ncbi:MAG TPA: sensor histidine kinase [Steroidobacteraceae bacterium]|jgi:signal transduction histidine kinase|nr:sensor histidine kinase [Steroidobacteraceae bacterium]
MVSAGADLTRKPSRGWTASFGLLPLPTRIALLLALVVIILIAATSERTSALMAMTLVSLALLAATAGLLVSNAAHRERERLAAERQGMEFEKLLELRTRELSELSTHLQELAEKEKSELARHLHDELGGLLTAAKMDLSWMQSRLPDAQYGGRLAQLGTVLDEAMDLKRRVVEQLRPSLLDHFGLPTALRAHVESVCTKASLQYEVTMSEDAESIPKDCAIALFRVVQEGLTNIVRHAHARQVRLALTSDDKRFLLLLIDDGKGMQLDDARFRWSHGLAGMRQRVQALGGQFAIESSPAEGTTLRIELPKTRTAGAPAQLTAQTS